MKRAILLTVLPFLFLGLFASGCAGMKNTGFLVVSSPELKESAIKQEKDVSQLIAHWEETKELVNELDQQSLMELNQLTQEIDMMVAQKEGLDTINGTAQWTEPAVLKKMHELPQNYRVIYQLAKKRLDHVSNRVARQELIQQAMKAVDAEKVMTDPAIGGRLRDIYLAISERDWFLDEWDLHGSINGPCDLFRQSAQFVNEGKGDPYDNMVYLYIYILGNTDDLDDYDILEREIGSMQDLELIQRKNWAVMDKRLLLVKDAAQGQKKFINNDIETPNWEKLANALGQIVEASESLKKKEGGK